MRRRIISLILATVLAVLVSPGVGSPVQAAPPAPYGIRDGIFTGQYYSNVELVGTPTLVRDDGKVVDFNWSDGLAAPGLPADNFSVRWTGTFKFQTGTYVFSTFANDGVRVRVDDIWVVDDWSDHEARLATGNTNLVAGSHVVTVEYYDRAGLSRIKVGWQLLGVVIRPANHPPEAADDQATTNEDQPVTILVLINDSDRDKDTLTPVLVDLPQHGTAIVNGGGGITYKPAPNWNGIDKFSYKDFDGHTYGNEAIVTVTVNSVNHPPVAYDDKVITSEDKRGSGFVLGNDVDVDGDSLTTILIGGVSHGKLIITSQGSFVYDPVPDWSGTDSFTYQAFDGAAPSNLATATIEVTPVNDPPVAKDDAAITNEDTATTISVLGNDTDIEGDALTAELLSQPSHGSLSGGEGGPFTYTPEANWNGQDSFTYAASDGTISSEEATVTITVLPVNDQPMAYDDSTSTTQDVAVTICVVCNDTDPEGDTLEGQITGGPSHGTLSGSAVGGSVTYTPEQGWSGTDSFTYMDFDGTVNSNQATVTIVVQPVVNPYKAVNDSYTFKWGSSVGIAAPGVLANDVCPSGGCWAQLTSNWLTECGMINVNPDGSFDYSPRIGVYCDWDSFIYQLSGGPVASTATVKLTFTH